MVEPLRHRQTKEAETDMFDLKAAAPHLDSTKNGGVDRATEASGVTLTPDVLGAVRPLRLRANFSRSPPFLLRRLSYMREAPAKRAGSP